MMFFLEMQRNLKNTEKTLKIFRLRRANNIRIAISNESQKNTSEDRADTEHRMESLSPKLHPIIARRTGEFDYKCGDY